MVPFFSLLTPMAYFNRLSQHSSTARNIFKAPGSISVSWQIFLPWFLTLPFPIPVPHLEVHVLLTYFPLILRRNNETVQLQRCLLLPSASPTSLKDWILGLMDALWKLLQKYKVNLKQTNPKKFGKITQAFLAERLFYMQPNGRPEAFNRRQRKQSIRLTLHQGPRLGKVGRAASTTKGCVVSLGNTVRL